MNHTEAQYILSIAKHLSISKAAEELYVSQPHLSRTLMRIEKDLGVKLFDRTKLPIQLTYAGKRYVDYCKRFETLRNEMTLEFKEISNSHVGQLTLGIPPVRGSYLLPIILPKFAEMYPQTKIIIQEGNSVATAGLVERGEVDIGIFCLPEIPSSLNCTVLLEDHLLLMVPSGHSLAYENTADEQIPHLEPDMLNMLEGEKFISIDSPNSITKRLIHYLARHHINCSISIKTKNNVMTYRLCEQGMGCAAIMEVAAHNTAFYKKPCLYQIDSPLLRETWCIATPKGHSLSMEEEGFISIAKKHAIEMVSSPFHVIG